MAGERQQKEKTATVSDEYQASPSIFEVRGSITAHSAQFWGNAEIGIVPFWPVEDLAFQFTSMSTVSKRVDLRYTPAITYNDSIQISTSPGFWSLCTILLRFYTVPKL